jgi:TolB-like protein
MGEVYRARDTRLGRDVAVKVLPVQFAVDPDRLRRFEQEARAVAALSHPNILALYDVGTHEGSPFIVSELLEGETLRDRLKSGGLTVRKAVETAVQIAQGLAAAHEKGIVHRDLKPANVFVTKDGHVKILDFGIAKLTRPDPGPQAATLTPEPSTETGGVLGTVGYMSPEQVRGLPADHRTDIFSFGCVLYEMLSGRSPFHKDTAAETMTAILHEDPPALAGIGREIPQALEGIVTRCLEKRPDDRFSSAHDLALALGAHSGATETPAKVKAPVRMLRVRRPWLVGAAGVGLLGVVATALLVWAPLKGAGPALDPKKVVVAPFDNRTGDASLDSFGSLIAEAVARNAAVAGGTSVVPGTSFAAKGGERASGSALRTLAKDSGAGLVVSGAYYAADDELRIQAQLFDGSQRSVLVTFEPITGSRHAPSSLLEPLRQRVLGAVACLSDDAMYDPRLVHIPTIDAWAEFQHGRELSNKDSLPHFTRATELDPDFMFARAGPSVFGDSGQCDDVARVLADLESRLERYTRLERLYVACIRAGYEGSFATELTLLDEMDALIARSTGGRISYELRWQRGYDELMLNLPRRALATISGIPTFWAPATAKNRWWARHNLTWVYHSLGEYETELKIADESLLQFPDVLAFYEDKVRALAALGRPADIDRAVDEALAVTVRAGSAGRVMGYAASELRAHGHRDASLRIAERAVVWYRARPAEEAAKDQRGVVTALFRCERWAEAKAIADTLLAKTPDDDDLKTAVALIAARLGDTSQARRLADELRGRKLDCKAGRVIYQRACLAAQAGDKREAMALLREAIARGFSQVQLLHIDMNLEPLWGDPEFKEFLRPKG